MDRLVGRKMDYTIALKLGLDVAYYSNFNQSGEEIFFTDAPGYSTDIKAAMKILQILQNKKFMWSVNGSSEGGFWTVLYPPEGDVSETESCITPEEAICQAFLQLEDDTLR